MSKPIKVLLVDDHTMMRIGLKEGMANRKDLEIIHSAKTGKEGIAAYGVHQPDVVLLDYRLPDVDGVSVAKTIIEAYPEAKILMHTAYDGEEDIWRAVKVGVLGYLTKEAEMPEVWEALITVSEGAKYFPAKIAAKIGLRETRDDLSKREYEVLQLLSAGMSNKQIMAHLNLSFSTVRDHVTHILAKLKAEDRTHAVVKAIRRGIIHLDD